MSRQRFWKRLKRPLPLLTEKNTGKKEKLLNAGLIPKPVQANFWQIKIVVDENSVRMKEEGIEEKKEKKKEKKEKFEDETEETIPHIQSRPASFN